MTTRLPIGLTGLAAGSLAAIAVAALWLRPDPKDCIGIFIFIFAGVPPPPDSVARCQSRPLMPFERR